ncbi:MAG: hypothetical protein EBX51_04935 [Acidimicrobiia bacterium]|nr:hypothetical protein [Acidimicrobiia bacterium]
MGEAQGHGTWEPRAPWWRRYPSLYGALWRYSVTREMQFKANFLLWIVVEAMWFGLQLGFMSVIYGHTEDVAGWSRWQVILLVGCSHFIQQVFTAFFLTNVSDISEHIRTGRLDFMLLLPVNTRFLVSFRKVAGEPSFDTTIVYVSTTPGAPQVVPVPDWVRSALRQDEQLATA